MRLVATLAGALLIAGSAVSAQVLPPAYARGVTDVAGFASADGWQHAMALHAGMVTEIAFGKGQSQADVASVPAAMAHSAFEAHAFDLHRVVHVLQTDGDVIQTWFRADGDVGSRVLGTVPTGRDVAAFEDRAGLTHVVVLAADGTLVELTARALEAPSRRMLISVPGASRIAAFQAFDDDRCIVIAGHDNGEVQEVSYAPGGSANVSRLVGTGRRLLDVGGFYSVDDQRRHAVLLEASGAVREIFYHPTLGKGTAVLGSSAKAERLDAYFAPDGIRHVVLGRGDGLVREIAYGRVGPRESTLASLGDAVPRASLVGPVVDNAQIDVTSSPSPTGLTYAVAGDEAVRYAVSLNAGVWRGGSGLPWVPLGTSPRYGQSIAVDPADRTHLFVGERDGDAGPGVGANNAGLWESADMGEHWSYTLDPLVLSDPQSTCTSQSVPSIVALADGGAIAATQCVLVRRKGRTGPFAPMEKFWGRGPFSGVASTSGCGKTFVWARTLRNLLWSDDDGSSVNQVALPPSAPDGAGAPQTILTADGTRGEGFGFAAYGCRAAFVVRVPDKDDPKIQYVASLEFDTTARTWRVDRVDAGSGVGLGGRIFIKAEEAAGYTHRTGQAYALLLSAAQNVFLGRARGEPRRSESARGIEWRPVAETPWHPRPPDHYLLEQISDIHSDIWDAHVSGHPTDPGLIVATDGGASVSPLGNVLSAAAGHSPQYLAANRGMATQHVHVMEIVDPSYAHRSGVLTASVDNDSWWRAAAPFAAAARPWHNGANLGDGNFVFADPRVTDAAVVWRHAQTNGVVRDLAREAPGLDGRQQAYPLVHFRNEHQYAVVPRGDGDPDALSLVALARKGIEVSDTRAVLCDGSEAPEGSVDGSGWQTVLVRTGDFAAHRKIGLPDPAGDGWSKEADAPSAAERVWASGRRASPTYFFYAETDSTGIVGLYRRRAGQTFFEALPGMTAPLFSLPYCGVNGPLFPSPYDATVVYGIATDGVWRLAGDAFVRDDVLTALVTSSGTYPFVAAYVGDTPGMAGDGSGLYLKPSQTRALSTLVDVAFDPADTYRVAAASAYGSVFYMDRREGFWRDLTPYLPRPLTAVSNVAIAHDGVYVAFEGRSVWKVEWPELAPEATYFEAGSASSIATLKSASGRPMIPTTVSIVVPATATAPPISATVTSGASGEIPLPAGVASVADLRGRAVRLRATPSGALAPAERSVVY